MSVSKIISNPSRAMWIWIGLAGTFLSGCFGDAVQSTIQPASEIADSVLSVYAIVTWIDIGIFIIVFGLLIIALVRFRGAKTEEIPKQVHGNAVMELTWTIVPAILLIFIAVPTWEGIFFAANPPTENVVHVVATGKQWWWEFEYPESGAVTGNEMHLPVGRPVVIITRSTDVIHSFWAPRLSGKMDSVPGRDNTIWFTPREKGTYYGQCAEYCGTSHANMRFRIIVEDEADYNAWIASIQQPPQPDTDDARAGQQLFAAKACVACHTISGVPGALGRIGPNLNNLGARTTIGSSIMDNTPQNLAAWIKDSRSMKPGVLMVLPIPVSDDEARQLAAYLISPPGMPSKPKPAASSPAPSAASAVADSGAAGKALFMEKGCVACHTIKSIPAARGTIGPLLDGLMKREKIAGGKLTNNEANLKRWIKDPPAAKPGTLMVNLGLSDAEVEAIVKYLMTL